jgi:hypothetical protein
MHDHLTDQKSAPLSQEQVPSCRHERLAKLAARLVPQVLDGCYASERRTLFRMIEQQLKAVDRLTESAE